jgi:ribonuclease-3
MGFDEIQERLGVEFTDPDILFEALTHPSSLSEPQMGFHRSNEALAWLGDALIDWVVSEAIYNPTSSRGDLTEKRKRYVGEKALAELAKKLGLDNALIIPEHRVNEGGRTNQKNLHTVYEAVVGAIYRDKDFKQAKNFVLKSCLCARSKKRDFYVLVPGFFFRG